MSKTTAFALIGIASEFTPADVQRYGTERLKYVLGLPRQVQARLLNLGGGYRMIMREAIRLKAA